MADFLLRAFNRGHGCLHYFGKLFRAVMNGSGLLSKLGLRLSKNLCSLFIYNTRGSLYKKPTEVLPLIIDSLLSSRIRVLGNNTLTVIILNNSYRPIPQFCKSTCSTQSTKASRKEISKVTALYLLGIILYNTGR